MYRLTRFWRGIGPFWVLIVIFCVSYPSFGANLRSVQVLDSSVVEGNTNTVSIELQAQGDENGVGFSLNFDTNTLRFIQAQLGPDAGAASFFQNTNHLSSGQVGFALALPVEQTFTAGSQIIITAMFQTLSGSGGTTTSLIFGDSPIIREISDTTANTLPTSFLDGNITIFSPLALGHISDISIDENTIAGPVSFTVGGGVVPPDNLNVNVSSTDSTLIPDANIVIGGTGTNRSLTVIPATDQFGSAFVILTLTDGSTTTSEMVGVTVRPVNQPPVAVADSKTTPENVPLTFPATDLTANDSVGPANEAVGFSSLVYDNSTTYLNKFFGAGNGVEFGDEISLAGSSRNVTDFWFEYFLNSGTGGETGELTFRDMSGPTNSFGATPGSIFYDSGSFSLIPGFHTVHASGLSLTAPDDLTWSVVFSGLSDSEKAGLLLYSPPTVGSSQSDFWILTNGVWTLSIFPDGTPANFGARMQVLTPGQVLSVISVSSTTPGASVILSGGQVTYTPPPNFYGVDTFQYVIADSGTPSLMATGTVTVTVTFVNQPPVTEPDFKTADRNVPLTFSASDLLVNDSPGPANESGQVLSVVSVSAASAQGGTVSLLPGANGLRGEYFANTGLTDSRLIRTDPLINFDWSGTSPDPVLPTVFSVRWTGSIVPRFSEVYTFTTVSDDGVRLFINDVPIINNWTGHGPTADQGTISLVAGQFYDIRLEYFEDFGGQAVISLSWSSKSQASELVPTSQLFTAAGGGIVTYTPPPNFIGTDTFTYTVSDGAGGTAEGLVTVDVRNRTFRITSLLPDNSFIIDHLAVTGPDDLGGIAVSSSQVFYNGGGATAQFNNTDLSRPTTLSQKLDSMASNLHTEQVYSLANGDALIGQGGGVVTALTAIDGDTGQVRTNSQIMLSTAITAPSGSGIFSGYDRIVLFNGDHVFNIDLPSGNVTDLGHLNALTHQHCESWAFWGVAEYIGGVVYLDYVQDSSTIVRARVPDGLVTPIGKFTDLSDNMCLFAFSLSLNRWYFHYDLSNQFGGLAESLGFADATWDQSDTNALPFISPVPDQVIDEGTTAGPILVSFSDNETRPDGLIFQVSSSNTDLIPPANIIVTGKGNSRSLTLVPVTNGFGSSIITITLQDANGGIATNSFGLTVNAVNHPPIAGSDLAAALEDVELTLTVSSLLANDLPGPPNESSQTLMVTAVDPASARGGVVHFNAATGLITYSPTLHFNGFDAFNYTITDNGTTDGLPDPKSAVGTVLITVAEVNQPPVAAPDFKNTAEDADLTFVATDLLVNDSPGPANESQQTLTLTSVSATSANGGTVNLFDGQITYHPALHFNGTDTFTYTITDNGTTSGLPDPKTSTGTVTVTVTEVNQPPIAAPDFKSTAEDATLIFAATDLLANDLPGPANESGQTLSVTSVSSASAKGGTVTLAGGNITYHPALHFNGTDTFTYTITDNGTTAGLPDPKTAVGTVTVTVTEVNQPPSAAPDFKTGAEDTSLTFAATDLLVNDSPGPANESGQTLTVASVSSASAKGGTVTLTGGNITYHPALHFNGTDTFTYTATDNGTTAGLPDPKTAVGTVTVTVTEVNQPPIAAPDFKTGGEDTSLTFAAIDLLANDLPGPANESGQTLTVTSVSSASAKGGTVTLAGGNITFHPALHFNGTDTFTYTITDNGTTASLPDPKTAVGTVIVTVTEVNQPPIAGPDFKTGVEDMSLTFAATELLANDSPGPANESAQTLTVTSVSSASANGGTVTLAGGNITFHPALHFNGTDTFTYTITDNGTTAGVPDPKTAVGTVTVLITEVNQPPIAVADAKTDAEDKVLTFPASDLTANDSPGPSNESGQTLAVTSVSSVSGHGGTVVLAGGNITYTPALHSNGTDTFTYTVTDNGTTAGLADPKSASATVTVTVTEVNQPPIAVADSKATLEDKALTFPASDLTANDSPGPLNESGQTLTVTSVSSTSGHGGTVVLAGGNITYTPALHFNGTDTFTYTITDNGTTAGVPDPKTAVGTVTVTITFVNQLPTISSIPDQSMQEGTNLVVGFTVSDFETAAANLSVQTSSDNSVLLPNSAIALGGSGGSRTLTLTPVVGQTGAAFVTVNVTDSDGGSASVAFALAVAPKPPVNLAGVGQDGYIANGMVFFDANGNGILDGIEPSTTTDGKGNFHLDVSLHDFDTNNNGKIDPSEGHLVIQGGTDIATGLPLQAPLTAPAGSTVITPLTTLITSLLSQDSSLTAAAAASKVGNSLGLPAGVDLTTYDPFAAASTNDPNASAILVASAKVQDTIVAVQALLSTSGGTTGSLSAAAFSSLATRMAGGGTVDLSQSNTISAIISAAANASGATLATGAVAAASTILAGVNSQEDQLLSLTNSSAVATQASRVEVVAQGHVSGAIQDMGHGTISTSDAVAQNTGSALNSLIASAPVGDVFGVVINPGTFAFEKASFRVTEGGIQVDPVTIVRTNGNIGPVELIVTLSDGTATLAENDYVPTPIHVFFADREVIKTVNLTSVIVNDTIAEDDETIQLTLSLATGAPAGAVLGALTTAVLNLEDDDRPPVAGADNVNGVENTPLDIPVATLLANDTDPDRGDILSVTSVTPTSAHGGIVTLSGGVVHYIPATYFHASDTFSYTIQDLQGHPATGQVTVAVALAPLGFEGDVSPRPNGANNGTITIADWVQVGRFAAGLDVISSGDEFARADCAPRATLGDGKVNIADWVQTGRYAISLDPVVPVGGPTGPVVSIASIPIGTLHLLSVRQLSASNVTVQAGQTNTLAVNLTAQGDENAIGFSLSFDTNLVSFTSVRLGPGMAGALLLPNLAGAASGKVGVGVALSPGQTLTAGTVTVVEFGFMALPGKSGPAVVTFSDQPVTRDIVGANVEELATTYANGTITITPGSSSGSDLKLSITRQAPTSLIVNLTGLTAGASYIIDTSTNLGNLTGWTQMTTLSATNSSMLFNQTVDNHQALYFRARTN